MCSSRCEPVTWNRICVQRVPLWVMAHSLRKTSVSMKHTACETDIRERDAQELEAESDQFINSWRSPTADLVRSITILYRLLFNALAHYLSFVSSLITTYTAKTIVRIHSAIAKKEKCYPKRDYLEHENEYVLMRGEQAVEECSVLTHYDGRRWSVRINFIIICRLLHQDNSVWDRPLKSSKS